MTPAQPGADSGGIGDPRFFARSGPHPLATIAAAAGATVAGGGERFFAGVAPLQSAGPDEVSFLDNRRYVDALATTRAGAVIVHPDLADRAPEGCFTLVTNDPYLGWARVAALFHPLPPVQPGIHPRAWVAPDAIIDPSAEIGPCACVDAGARIGPRCRLGPHAVIGPGVVLGADCRIGAGVTITHAIVGARVVIHPGARIGQDGFGFATERSGPDGQPRFVPVPQLGRVLIGDDADIGANTTIDRGSAQDTVIGPGSRLDNLVQIGHNVRLGRCCVVVAQAGISGSTELGDFAVVAAQAGLTGHLRIGARARIGAQAGVMADVAEGQDVVGSPAMPARSFFRQVAVLRRLAERRPKEGTS
ncbi:MAG: UDP-3-O-(3-hydroxymyristoyl)glucosamine N-acyltransferase [Rhodospirillales bacterium]|nr:UDP-3-O-(3-hydroxymyristoyl)glucosamine N-acyltransferase [Rhodospirillales bacterium]